MDGSPLALNLPKPTSTPMSTTAGSAKKSTKSRALWAAGSLVPLRPSKVSGPKKTRHNKAAILKSLKTKASEVSQKAMPAKIDLILLLFVTIRKYYHFQFHALASLNQTLRKRLFLLTMIFVLQTNFKNNLYASLALNIVWLKYKKVDNGLDFRIVLIG
jgi:hypothetical protein